MAFALVNFNAYVMEADEPLVKKRLQRVKLKITGLNTDVAYDFGACTAGGLGTFWTAVSGTEPGASCLKVFQDVQTKVESFLGIYSEQIANKARVYATSSPVASYLSAASAGGGATETYTVTGLAVGDTVIAVTPAITSPNAVYTKAYGAVGAASLPVTYSGDPGVGAKVKVTVLKAAGTGFAAGSYNFAMDATNTHIPSLTFISGDAPTTSIFVLDWELPNGMDGDRLVGP